MLVVSHNVAEHIVIVDVSHNVAEHSASVVAYVETDDNFFVVVVDTFFAVVFVVPEVDIDQFVFLDI
jgi:hypothetical protein